MSDLTNAQWLQRRLQTISSCSIQHLRAEAERMSRMMRDGLTEHSNKPSWSIGRERDGELAELLIQHMRSGGQEERIAALCREVKDRRQEILAWTMDDGLSKQLRRCAIEEDSEDLDVNSIPVKQEQDEDIRLMCEYAKAEFEQIEYAVVICQAIRARMSAAVCAMGGRKETAACVPSFLLFSLFSLFSLLAKARAILCAGTRRSLFSPPSRSRRSRPPSSSRHSRPPLSRPPRACPPSCSSLPSLSSLSLRKHARSCVQEPAAYCS